jgi:hypothetical protein
MNYRKINNLTGWLTGIIAYLVYLLTMEPTVSFWDCGEFLSCAYKLEVGHSPGAPLFMMLQRMFAFFAGGHTLTGGASQSAALFINSFSALTSGLTILFLFWTITYLAKKILVSADNNVEPAAQQTVLIMGTGLVGALAYTFSDTFWFSAVEAEVYATSSFFTAFVIWAIFKWESIADNKYADRWLVLIAYMMGLSVGIHLLNLLTIPALGMVYYYKRYRPTAVGAIVAFLVGCAFLALVQFGIIQGIPALASMFDLLFVNSFGLPFDSGAIFFIIVLCALLVGLLIFAKKRNHYLLHTVMLCLIFIVIGFSSYMAPVIRSRANVAIDMTNPDNANRFLSYVNREQFGSQPLLSGPYFTAEVQRYENDGNMYNPTQKDGKDYYEVVGTKPKPVFTDNTEIHLFPRIWDYQDPSGEHQRFYRNYLDLSEGEDPSSADNMKFFLGYQLNWMWWRYFMWNYAGRQNDMEGQGEARNGNWISGIQFIDKAMGRGNIDLMGKGMRDNPARNQLYFLPLLLGIAGMVYQFNRQKKDGIIVGLLFFFTGIAVVLYLNNTPLQPRERDYAYAGSTYAFAIWIGLGVLVVANYLKRFVKGISGIYLAILLCLLAVPTLMAKEEWNDHDRSRKTLARATAYNTLQSCEKNAVLFTFGDNDTYPLWYLQEVEGIRTDVRIINLSLLGIDWYIDQLNYKINEADKLSMFWTSKDYVGDRKNYLRIDPDPRLDQTRNYNLIDICKFFVDEKNQKQYGGSGAENYIPTQNLMLPSMSKEDLVKNGLVSAQDTNRVDNQMNFKLSRGAIYKNDIAVLNIVAGIAADGWKRPVYFGGGLPGNTYQGMQDYLKLEGSVYRVVPYKFTDTDPSNNRELGFVDMDKSYNLFMNTYIWGGAEANNVYYDEKNRIMFTAYRNNAPRIAIDLFRHGRKDDAKRILDKIDTAISQTSYAYNPYLLGFDPAPYFISLAYYQIGDKEKGRKVALQFTANLEADLNWILSLNENARSGMTYDLQRDFGLFNAVAEGAKSGADTTTFNELTQKGKLLESKVLQNVSMPAENRR